MRMARSWEMLALIQDLAQQAALAPLHHHVDARALFVAKDAHHVGMIEPFADARLALEAIEEDWIGFHVGVRNLEGDGAVVAHIVAR